MKVFGYVEKQHNENGLVELSEITFQASPDTLREIASFLVVAAQKAEELGSRFDHFHIQQVHKDWHAKLPERPDIVVSQLP